MTEPIEHPPPASAFERALLRSIAGEAGPRGWQLLDGMPYWCQGPLFCLLIPFADARQGHARVTLSLKWRALDRVLWSSLGLAPPAGLRAHAASAQALPGWTVYRSAVSGLGWPSEALERWTALAVQGAADCAARLQGELDALPHYLEFIGREHRTLLERQPHASSRLEQERVLAVLLLEDAAATSLELARA